MGNYIDIPWLLDVQDRVIPEDPTVADYSALVAAVARHKTRFPTVAQADPDAAWRCAALLQTIICLEPLPYRNELYACSVATQYMAAVDEGIDPPYGALFELVREMVGKRVGVYAAGERIRSWKI